MRIFLTRKKYALVDGNFEFLKNFKWRANGYFKNKIWYAARDCKNSKGKFRVMLMHHVIIGFPLKNKVVDHINGNGLDNRLKNLRIVSQRLNCANTKKRRLHKTNSKYVGVCRTSTGSWRSRAVVNGKEKYLGTFKKEKEAAHAYQKFLKTL